MQSLLNESRYIFDDIKANPEYFDEYLVKVFARMHRGVQRYELINKDMNTLEYSGDIFIPVWYRVAFSRIGHVRGWNRSLILLIMIWSYKRMIVHTGFLAFAKDLNLECGISSIPVPTPCLKVGDIKLIYEDTMLFVNFSRWELDTIAEVLKTTKGLGKIGKSSKVREGERIPLWFIVLIENHIGKPSEWSQPLCDFVVKWSYPRLRKSDEFKAIAQAKKLTFA